MPSETPNADALRALLARIRDADTSPNARPFAHSTLRLDMPTSPDAAETAAIRRYEAALVALARELEKHPLGTLANIEGAPFFLCPIINTPEPQHRPVLSSRVQPPLAADGFEGIGADEINELADWCEAWVKAPTFDTTDLEAEIDNEVGSCGDLFFASIDEERAKGIYA